MSGNQHQGAETEVRPVPFYGEGDLIANVVEAVRETLKDKLETKHYKEDQICIVLTSTTHSMVDNFLLLFLNLKRSFPGIKVLFEVETLSLEWPVVIVCGMKKIKLELFI